MRKYYLSVDIICDGCGIKDNLDNGSLTEEGLEPHISRYYTKHDGKELCENCHQEALQKKGSI